MNDLLKLSPTPCACGSPLQAVTNVEGRQDDIFQLRGARGDLIFVTPDVVRNAVVDADRRIQDFRIIQTSADEIELFLAASIPSDAASAAVENLKRAFARLGVSQPTIVLKRGLDVPMDRKLRRIRQEWRSPHS